MKKTRMSLHSGARQLDRTCMHRAVGALDLHVISSKPDPRTEYSADGIGTIANSAFPYDSDTPTRVDQACDRPLVPLVVVPKFLVPEFGPAFRKTEVGAAAMAMPEAAVHEYDRLPFRKHQVGLTGQALGV